MRRTKQQIINEQQERIKDLNQRIKCQREHIEALNELLKRKKEDYLKEFFDILKRYV